MKEIRNTKEYNHFCIIRKHEFTKFINMVVGPFFTKITYSIKTRNGSEVEFDSLDDLFEWNNFDNNSVVELRIFGRNINDTLYVVFRQKCYSNITFGIKASSIYLSYSFNEIGNYNNFVDYVDKNIYLIKNNDYNKTFTITPRVLNFSLYIILILGSTLFGIYDLVSGELIPLFLFFSCCTAIITFITNLYYNKYVDYYPRVVFYFGDGINLYENSKENKIKIFSLCGQFIIGIASSLIVYFITTFFK